MPRTRALWLGAALIASSALTATMTHAQQPPTQQPPTSMVDRMFQRLQQSLGLTDDQVNQIRAIHQGQRDARRQLWQSLRQAQRDLRQLALSGGDASALAAKKAELAQLQAQGLDLRIQALQQIGPILTQEQRDKLAQMGPAAMWRGHQRQGPKPTQG